MTFNPYIWHLYRQSEEGHELIRDCASFLNAPPQISLNSLEGIMQQLPWIAEKQNHGWIHDVHGLGSDVIVSIISELEAENKVDHTNVFEKIVSEGFAVDWEGIECEHVFGHNLDRDDLRWIVPLSIALAIKYPEQFFPYLFEGSFNVLSQIADFFQIPIPEVPRKRDTEKRMFYYQELNQVLTDFRVDNDLPPEELCPNLTRQRTDRYGN